MWRITLSAYGLLCRFSEKTPSPLESIRIFAYNTNISFTVDKSDMFFLWEAVAKWKIICPYGRWLRSGEYLNEGSINTVQKGGYPAPIDSGNPGQFLKTLKNQRIRGMPGVLQKPEVPYMARYSQRVYISSSRRADKPNSRLAVLIPEKNPEGFWTIQTSCP